MQQGQPALLYLVPCTLITGYVIGWLRGDLKRLWTGRMVLTSSLLFYLPFPSQHLSRLHVSILCFSPFLYCDFPFERAMSLLASSFCIPVMCPYLLWNYYLKNSNYTVEEDITSFSQYDWRGSRLLVYIFTVFTVCRFFLFVECVKRHNVFSSSSYSNTLLSNYYL